MRHTMAHPPATTSAACVASRSVHACTTCAHQRQTIQPSTAEKTSTPLPLFHHRHSLALPRPATHPRSGKVRPSCTCTVPVLLRTPQRGYCTLLRIAFDRHESTVGPMPSNHGPHLSLTDLSLRLQQFPFSALMQPWTTAPPDMRADLKTDNDKEQSHRYSLALTPLSHVLANLLSAFLHYAHISLKSGISYPVLWKIVTQICVPWATIPRNEQSSVRPSVGNHNKEPDKCYISHIQGQASYKYVFIFSHLIPFRPHTFVSSPARIQLVHIGHQSR